MGLKVAFLVDAGGLVIFQQNKAVKFTIFGLKLIVFGLGDAPGPSSPLR